jgi:hypothetical protein
MLLIILTPISSLENHPVFTGARGSVVVKALRYKQEGSEFDTR